ncbi:MAG: type II secretion system protein GspG [Myxococcaceae bacterium]|nr:type II secretion system protein GspG [Myxococcaceae bacterium]MCI0671890.1 type II secretion system protein GspG [Myxococcaceae bacterium]
MTRNGTRSKRRRSLAWGNGGIGLRVAALVGWLMSGCSLCWEQKELLARSDVSAIQNGLDLYFTKTGKYPATASGLKPLLDEQILERTMDPWGNEYIYLNAGSSLVVTSLGADGEPGGEGAAADISAAMPKR